uniref:Uncharacterized protein n=1 Tax=Hyaloperonospora arabidopsidis (strain Emoy2) TaxID=559515 RepID=M4B975_HYAAE
MSKQASGSTGGSHSKRKRDASHERKVPLSKVRQEHMEEEFAATYHGLTALYKLLEVQHLQSPLFLPRTLSYRLDPAWQQKELKDGTEEKQKEKMKLKQQVRTVQAGATLTEFKIGMTSETMEAFQSQTQRVGVLLSLFQADGKLFRDNEFKLLATCLIPVPFTKHAVLPAELLSQTTSLRGKQLLSMEIDGRKPLYSNLLRLDASRRRVGLVTVELPAIATSVHGGVKCEFRIVWHRLPQTEKMQRLETICSTKFRKEDEDPEQSNENFLLAVPKRDISTAARKPCAGGRTLAQRA